MRPTAISLTNSFHRSRIKDRRIRRRHREPHAVSARSDRRPSVKCSRRITPGFRSDFRHRLGRGRTGISKRSVEFYKRLLEIAGVDLDRRFVWRPRARRKRSRSARDIRFRLLMPSGLRPGYAVGGGRDDHRAAAGRGHPSNGSAGRYLRRTAVSS